MIYALVLTLCVFDGECHETIPAVYDTEYECSAELVHQRAQGIPKGVMHCELLED